MAKCTACDSENAYLGFNSILCICKSCKFFDEKYYNEYLENLAKKKLDERDDFNLQPESSSNPSTFDYSCGCPPPDMLC